MIIGDNDKMRSIRLRFILLSLQHITNGINIKLFLGRRCQAIRTREIEPQSHYSVDTLGRRNI